jgi:hypothetical protein
VGAGVTNCDSKARRRAARLLSCYPRAWRTRYGEEFSELLMAEMEERPHSSRRVLDVARGGFVARLAVAGLAGQPLDRRTQPSRCLVTLGATVSCFLVLALALWAQLTIGWQWARPSSEPTELAMVVMTVAVVLVVALFVAAAAPILALALAAIVRGRGRPLLRPMFLVLLGLALLVVGTHHFANGWPGTGGHPWTHQGLVPGGVAAYAWASTLFVTSYWLHPAALVRFPGPELWFMLLSPLATVSVIVGSSKIVHRLTLQRGLLRFEQWLGIMVALSMGLFLTGAALWVIEGGPGPRNLFHIGAIDVIELVLLTLTAVLALRAAEQARPGIDRLVGA